MRAVHRVFFPVPEPAPEAIELEGEGLHHLIHVLRLSAGDAVEVFDGKGRAFDGRIEAVTEKRARISLESARALARAGRSIALLQGLPKAAKLEWVLEKGTELGASAFVPVLTERGVVKLTADRKTDKLKRWRRIVEQAARQCGRADVPTVQDPSPLLEAAGALPHGTQLLILDEEEEILSLGRALALHPKDAPLALVIGPEGGLTREEVAALVKLGGRSVSLGTLKLRTETAPLAALAIIRHLDGTLG
jgi:16S rRNA (uracil1498-N3)-methyltransferase